MDLEKVNIGRILEIPDPLPVLEIDEILGELKAIEVFYPKNSVNHCVLRKMRKNQGLFKNQPTNA